MRSPFVMECEPLWDSLYVRPSGDLDEAAAWELVGTLRCRFQGRGCIYIDTCELRNICPHGRDTFHALWNMVPFAADQVFFLGDKGGRIAPKGCRVLPGPEKKGRCKGNCKDCPCARQKQAGNNKPDLFFQD